MNRRTKALGIAAVGALAVSVPTAGSAVADSHHRHDRGPKIVALTDSGNLMTVRADRPDWRLDREAVRGLTGDTKLVGIDHRVQDGKLYGVGDQGGIYTVKPRTGQATKVSQLSVPLDGTQFGVDFNPAANRLRVVSDTGQNLRHNIDDPMGAPAPGITVVDGPLTYPATPTTPATVATGVSAAAYTNNDLDVNTATTLFDIDTTLDQVVVQSPANAGSLAATGKLADESAPAGFDIYSEIRRGTTVANRAFAVFSGTSRSHLYEIDLLTGKAIKIGSSRGSRVVDIAVSLDTDRR